MLLIWILAICIIPNIALSITEPLSFPQKITNIILPLGIYGLLCSVSRHIGRTGLWMFIAMFFAAFQIVLIYLFGRSVIAVDMFLNLVTTNPGEVNELLGNMLPIIIVVAILYLPSLIICIVAVIKKWRLSVSATKRFRIISMVIVGIGGLFFAISFTSTRKFHPISDIYPLNVAENIVIAVNRTAKVEKHSGWSSDFTYKAHSIRPDSIREIYVMVIGETSRAPQWKILGYGKENTTAPLDTIKNLIGFSRAISESNTTHKSVPMLLSPFNASTFEDSIYSSKSIITAFKEAGYKTAFFSNQARNHSFIDFFGQEADTTLFINEANKNGSAHLYDHDLLTQMQKFLSENTTGKLFIVLHTYGSHFCYSDRYPINQEPFAPDAPIEVTAKNTHALVNAYNNTIHYTARFLANIISMLKNEKCYTAMIYTSDHGEDIFDDSRRLFLHASPVPSYYQIHVPLLLWFSPQIVESYPNLLTNATNNSAKKISSSDTFFNTTLTLGGISATHYNPHSDLTSSAFKEKPLIYLNDHNEGIPLKDAGLQTQDFEKFREIGINE